MSKPTLIVTFLIVFFLGIGIGNYLFSPQIAEANILTDVFDNTLNLVVNVFGKIFAPILRVIANTLPTVSESSMPFGEAMTRIMILGWQFSFIIPWVAVFNILWAMIGLEISIMIVKLVMWGVRLARG